MSGGFAERDRVLDGIRAANDAGLTPIKINAVVERGLNDHTVLDLVEHFRGTGIIVRFIEYMDVGNRNHWSLDRVVPSRELVERIGARWPLHPVEENYHGEVAERYAFDDGVGRDRLHLLDHEPVLRYLHAGAPVLRRRASIPACSRRRGPTFARRCARAPATTRCSRSSPRPGHSAAIATASCARRLSSEQPLRKIEMYYIGG